MSKSIKSRILIVRTTYSDGTELWEDLGEEATAAFNNIIERQRTKDAEFRFRQKLDDIVLGHHIELKKRS